MTKWYWYAGEIGDDTYDLVSDAPTREDAIKEASRQLQIGDRFQIIEARSSQAKKYEGSDFVPFLRTRNHEIVSVWGGEKRGAE